MFFDCGCDEEPRGMTTFSRRRGAARGAPRIRSLVVQNFLIFPLLCLLLQSYGGSQWSLFPVAQAQDCPLTIVAFATDADCDDQRTPSAVGGLYADNTCRETTLLQGSASNLLPGRYTARCTTDGRLAITDSGCTASDCSSAAAEPVCDRQFTISSFYSRLESPYYAVQSTESSVTGGGRCLVLSSGEMRVTFQIYGDCLNPSCAPYALFLDPPTEPPTSTPTSMPSLRPTMTPTQSPTFQPSTMAPSPTQIALSDVPAVSVAPTKGTVSSAESSGAPIGAIVGAAIGGLLGVGLILAAGYLIGARRQKRRDDAKQGSSSGHGADAYMSSDFQSPPSHMYPHSIRTPPSTGAVASEVTISVRRKNDSLDDNAEDDVSTLGTPIGLAYVDEATAPSVVDYDYMDDEQRQRQRLNSTGASSAQDTYTNTLTNTSGRSAFLMSGSLLADDESFERQYEKEDDEMHAFNGSGRVEGDVFQVSAPPGKLGMVIDDPRGYPQVVAMRPDSVLQSLVATGDRLIDVDGVDVTELSCLETSNLISRASDRIRRLTFSRGQPPMKLPDM